MKSEKRFVSVEAYKNMTGLSRPTIVKGCETGTIPAVLTETGQWRIDTQTGKDAAITRMAQVLDNLERSVRELCLLHGIKQ